MQDKFDQKFKLVLVGDTGVGKSNLINRFTQDDFDFDLQTKSTIGVGFFSKNVEIDGKIIKAEIWDTAGQERYKAITSIYYKNAHGVILVYDITKHCTFQNLENWLFEIGENAPKDVTIILLGNKYDLRHLRLVSTNEGQEFADKLNISFLEVSAFESLNVQLAFENLITEIYRKNLGNDVIEKNYKNFSNTNEFPQNCKKSKSKKLKKIKKRCSLL